MQTKRLKQTLRPHRGESPLASYLTVTGKVVVRGDGRYFSNNQIIYCYVYIPEPRTIRSDYRRIHLRNAQQHQEL